MEIMRLNNKNIRLEKMGTPRLVEAFHPELPIRTPQELSETRAQMQ